MCQATGGCERIEIDTQCAELPRRHLSLGLICDMALAPRANAEDAGPPRCKLRRQWTNWAWQHPHLGMARKCVATTCGGRGNMQVPVFPHNPRTGLCIDTGSQLRQTSAQMHTHAPKICKTKRQGRHTTPAAQQRPIATRIVGRIPAGGKPNTNCAAPREALYQKEQQIHSNNARSD